MLTISGFSMYFMMTQGVSLDLKNYRIFSKFLNSLMPRPLDSPPGFMIHKFLEPLMWYWGYFSLIWPRTNLA